MAKFEVHEVFRLPARQEIVIAGKVVEGRVAAGMEVRFELQPGLSCSASVKSVEFMDRVAAQETLVGRKCSQGVESGTVFSRAKRDQADVRRTDW
jgi:hypothetical protein